MGLRILAICIHINCCLQSYSAKITSHIFTEIHGKLSKTYKIKLSEKILMNIQLGVICTELVNLRSPGHILCITQFY